MESDDTKEMMAVVENAKTEESEIAALTKKKELPAEALEAIARKKKWMGNYEIRRAVAFHAHTPRATAMRAARELYLMDLVQLSQQPAATNELRRLAEELVLARLPQIPVGQRIAVARRGTARVTAGLLAQGPREVCEAALGNALMTEAQVLKTLAREDLREAVAPAIARSRKWSALPNVRAALVRHPQMPVESVLALLPEFGQAELEEMARSSELPARLREYVRGELARRKSKKGFESTDEHG